MVLFLQKPPHAPGQLAAIDALTGFPARHPEDVAAVWLRILALQGVTGTTARQSGSEIEHRAGWRDST